MTIKWPKPKIENAPGISWRKRADGWIAYWIAPAKVVDLGYATKTVRLWPPADQPHPGSPNATQQRFIAERCQHCQAEMSLWKTQGGTSAPAEIARMFDGTVKGLSRTYQLHKHSSFHKLRFKTRAAYISNLAIIEKTIGDRVLANLKGTWFLDCYEGWNTKSDGTEYAARAYTLMKTFRILITFGAGMLEDRHCQRIWSLICGVKDEGKPSVIPFQGGRKRRTTTINLEQAVAVRKKAHEMGRPEIALAQAFQFELACRQKDVIGEWIPLSYEGVSDVTARGKKWVCGIHWREISKGLILRHQPSKSARGRRELAVRDEEKTRTWDLKLYPMIMEELALVSPEKRTGALIVNPNTGLPFTANIFTTHWREIATAAGVPRNVQNRDARAGGLTEAAEAAGAEGAQATGGHKKMDTTMIYLREEDRRTAEAAKLRVERRSNKPSNVRSNVD